MEAERLAETLVSTYDSTRCHDPEKHRHNVTISITQFYTKPGDLRLVCISGNMFHLVLYDGYSGSTVQADSNALLPGDPRFRRQPEQ
jgi:hypothetical protein